MDSIEKQLLEEQNASSHPSTASSPENTPSPDSAIIVSQHKEKAKEISTDNDFVMTELAAVVERYVIDGATYARSAACKKLLEMPRLRQVTLRSGLQESTISTGRSQNMEAILGYTRGNILPQPCKECKTKPFASCVVVENMFHGSCMGCHYNSLGVKCSLRVTVSK